MAIVKKKNGKIRICLDPQQLNEALIREYYRLPTVNDILPDLYDAKLFSKLDVKDAFWHVILDEESSKLTTMSTPFGRFKWKRMPFGLKTSSEIFQNRLESKIGNIKGVKIMNDDIIVFGKGNTIKEAEKWWRSRRTTRTRTPMA